MSSLQILRAILNMMQNHDVIFRNTCDVFNIGFDCVRIVPRKMPVKNLLAQPKQMAKPQLINMRLLLRFRHRSLGLIRIIMQWIILLGNGIHVNNRLLWWMHMLSPCSQANHVIVLYRGGNSNVNTDRNAVTNRLKLIIGVLHDTSAHNPSTILKEWFNPHHPDRLMTTHVIRRHNGFLQQLRTMIFNKTHREKNPNLLWLMSLRENQMSSKWSCILRWWSRLNQCETQRFSFTKNTSPCFTHVIEPMMIHIV